MRKFIIIPMGMNSGFTLVELVVTVSVLVVLASLSLVNFQEYRAKAYDVVALNQLIMARSSFELMIADNIVDLSDDTHSLTYTYSSDLYEQFVHNGLVSNGLIGYVHVEGVTLQVCSRELNALLQPKGKKDEYFISSRHIKGTRYDPPSNGGRRIPTFQMQHSYNSNSGIIESNLTNQILLCPVPARPL